MLYQLLELVLAVNEGRTNLTQKKGNMNNGPALSRMHFADRIWDYQHAKYIYIRYILTLFYSTCGLGHACVIPIVRVILFQIALSFSNERNT
jgi:hypothetical protein